MASKPYNRGMIYDKSNLKIYGIALRSWGTQKVLCIHMNGVAVDEILELIELHMDLDPQETFYKFNIERKQDQEYFMELDRIDMHTHTLFDEFFIEVFNSIKKKHL